MRLRRRVSSAALSAVLILLGACYVSSEQSRSKWCEPFSIDLRSTPQRADVGQEEGERTVAHTCDDGVDVTLVLPDDTVTFELRRLGADSLLTPDPENDPPITIDLHSMWTSVEGAAELAGRFAHAFGVDAADALVQWKDDALSDTSDPGMKGLDVQTRWLRGGAGVADVEMRVSRESNSGDSSVHLIIHL